MHLQFMEGCLPDKAELDFADVKATFSDWREAVCLPRYLESEYKLMNVKQAN